MKKIFALAFVAATLFSCSDDDAAATAVESDLIGVWRLETSHLNDVSVASGCQLQNTVEFKADGTTKFTYYMGNTNCQVDAVETGNWTKNGDILTINWTDADAGEEAYVLNVYGLNDTTMRWMTEIQGEGTLVEKYSK